MPHRERYAKILDTLDSLNEGDVVEIIHDHDPYAMKEQLSQIMPGMFEWSYIEKGPYDWRVDIKKVFKKPQIQNSSHMDNLFYSDKYTSIH
nr:DUF2249 domain-containing protein [Oxobacter pfennigii]